MNLTNVMVFIDRVTVRMKKAGYLFADLPPPERGRDSAAHRVQRVEARFILADQNRGQPSARTQHAADFRNGFVQFCFG